MITIPIIFGMRQGSSGSWAEPIEMGTMEYLRKRLEILQLSGHWTHLRILQIDVNEDEVETLLMGVPLVGLPKGEEK